LLLNFGPQNFEVLLQVSHFRRVPSFNNATYCTYRQSRLFSQFNKINRSDSNFFKQHQDGLFLAMKFMRETTNGGDLAGQ